MLAASVEPDTDAVSRSRAGRYAARYVIWGESASLRRLRNCGRTRQSNASAVTVRVTDRDGSRHAGFGGVQSCGSVWACPVCSAKIAETRRQEIARALSTWQAGGGRVALATFTMRHHKGQSLSSLWDGLAKAWSATTSGRGWQSDRDLLGGIRWLRVVEGTYGAAGWHIHVHALLLLSSTVSADAVAHLEGSMFGRWSRSLVRQGFAAPLRSVGADIKLLQGDASDALGDYFTKSVYSPAERASFEVARGDLKDARHGNRTPFSILADVVAHGDADDLDTWHEWERGSRGRRQIGWSKGTRALLLADAPELTDEEIAAADDAGETVATLDRWVWAAVVESRALLAVLSAYERSRQAGDACLVSFAGLAAALEHDADQSTRALGSGRHRWRSRR